MAGLPITHNPPSAPGMLGLVLGTTALVLFFLPILGIPLAACGLLFGIIGVILSFPEGGARLRWSLLGCGMSFVTLAMNIGIAYAPGGYLEAPLVQESWQPVPSRAVIPPPAPARWSDLERGPR